MATADGSQIHIEERDGAELLSLSGVRTVAEGVAAFNPVFDVTPAELIDALVTERGVIEHPTAAKMAAVFGPVSSA
jgi:methylthioribose-1-phosphate isomerase